MSMHNILDYRPSLDYLYCTPSKITTNLRNLRSILHSCIDYAVKEIFKPRRLVLFLYYFLIFFLPSLYLLPTQKSFLLVWLDKGNPCKYGPFCQIHFEFNRQNTVQFFFLFNIIWGIRCSKCWGVQSTLFFYRLADDPLRSRSELPSVSSE